jgi:hypothetical protein
LSATNDPDAASDQSRLKKQTASTDRTNHIDQLAFPTAFLRITQRDQIWWVNGRFLYEVSFFGKHFCSTNPKS